jgi:hypothetical protein
MQQQELNNKLNLKRSAFEADRTAPRLNTAIRASKKGIDYFPNQTLKAVPTLK